MKKIFMVIFLSILFCSDKQIYSTVQMMDQIMIIDPQSLSIDSSILTEFGDTPASVDCIVNDSEMNCNMTDGCDWLMNMCMDSDISTCEDNNSEMSCNMHNECEWMMGMCMEDTDSSVINTPHFIALDEINGYWFVTTIASGFIAQFSLLDNSLIDTYFVGDAPALLVVDSINRKIYCSRMMPMNGMSNMMPNSESNIIQSIEYNAMGFVEVESQEYIISSPAPHGIAISDNGSEIYTASNTADWIYKIDTETNEIFGSAMDLEVSNSPDQVTQRLKPIQCEVFGSRLFISCSAGVWMNPFDGSQTTIEGTLQMWDTSTMTLIDEIGLGNHSAPWHIKKSPVDELIYVFLSGDNLYETEGLACIRFTDDNLVEEWITNDLSFDTLHGIDISSDGQSIYVSGRGDGNIHVFNSYGDYINNIFLGSTSMLGGIAIEQRGLPVAGDLNNDSSFSINDIILLIDTIFSPMMSSPYNLSASDVNEDENINIYDIVLLIDNIFSN